MGVSCGGLAYGPIEGLGLKEERILLRDRVAVNVP